MTLKERYCCFVWVDSQCGKAKLTYKLKRKTTTSSYLVSVLYSHFWVVAQNTLIIFAASICWSVLIIVFHC